jgi:sulfur carrier protein
MEAISIFINGTPQSFERALCIDDLIQQMGLVGKRIALERNGEIVPRSQFPTLMLADGDELEIVGAVGGG